VEAVVREGATVVVLDREAQGDESIVGQAAALHEAGIRVRTLTLFYDEWLGKLPVWELERVSLMFDIGEIHRARYGRLKRLADVAMSLVSAAVVVVVIPLVWLGNRFANRGPLFYRQARVGKNGATFQILKFRTMRANGASIPNEWTSEEDPRITPFGHVLRRTHLDELPQVLNILRGDLSVVGPRPEQPQYVRELTGKIPFYDLRHRVRPGLTGWAQVKYGYAGSESDALQKLQYEFYYLRHQSLTMDARILGRTIRHVVGRGGR
jgi:lipopolysaccharide/colanic/teichoic acid biosynthesis glycosyltransferase